jgi:hypothetical protein
MQAISKEKDTAYYIWELLFRCRVPQLQSTSVTYLKHFGTHTTGIEEIDRDLSNQLIDTAIPIVRMVEYYQKGVPVYIVKQEDVKTIYEYIENHIQAWKSRLEAGVNIGGAPIDDLVAMDEFAHNIYEHAKYHFTRETANSLMIRHMSKIAGFNSNNILKNPEEEKEENKYPNRLSMSDLFKERKLGMRRWK